ncbi:DUF6390 family protein [Mycobacterium sp. 050128]|uniref:DUF6390 family protein n=1 Tax=Mycobacterium sp. 050128 TaxID=3096112 RepID=UPI002ED7837C
MTGGDITPCGAAMFARYAYAPNQLGYCGPPNSPGLRGGTRDEIGKAARQFTGAWPYLQVMSRMTGIPDPLDYRLVDSYWLGGGVCAELHPPTFTRELLAILGPRAGHYWAHLTEDLAGEAAPNHSFHVFGVYPWSRLLGKGPEQHPLAVLDNCRITWATVLSSVGATALVESRRLVWTGTSLSLSAPEVHQVGVDAEEARQGPLTRGAIVATHWGRVCDRLRPEQVARLKDSTDRQLAATNRRLKANMP